MHLLSLSLAKYVVNAKYRAKMREKLSSCYLRDLCEDLILFIPFIGGEVARVLENYRITTPVLTNLKLIACE